MFIFHIKVHKFLIPVTDITSIYLSYRNHINRLKPIPLYFSLIMINQGDASNTKYTIHRGNTMLSRRFIYVRTRLIVHANNA